MVLFSASDGDEVVVRRQALTMLVGLIVMFIVAQFNVHFYRRWAPSVYAAGIALLGVVVVFCVL
jgi:rod shape determining protein RodA